MAKRKTSSTTDLKTIFLWASLAGWMLITGCAAGRPVSDRPQSYDCNAWTNEVTSAEQLGIALRYRWSLEAIQTYCRIVRPLPFYAQKFWAIEAWQGDLYADQPTGLDAIWWKASHENGRLCKFVLNATKGDKHWVVDCGTSETLLSEVRGARRGVRLATPSDVERAARAEDRKSLKASSNGENKAH